MESVTHFLSDLRLGYCTWNWFAPEFVCCKELATLTASVTPLRSQQPKSIYYSASALVVSSSSSPSSSSQHFITASASLNHQDENTPFSQTTCSAFVKWYSLAGVASSSSSSSSSFTIDDQSSDERTLRGFIFYVGFSVLFAVLAAIICSLHHPKSVAGSGLVQVKSILSGGRVMNHFLSFPVILAKATALCLAVGSGLFVGKEGPLVHLGTAVACTVRRGLRRYFNEGVVVVSRSQQQQQQHHQSHDDSNSGSNHENSENDSILHEHSASASTWGDCEIDDIDLDPPDVSSAQSNELLCAAAAAGVAAGFAAPLGGLLYVVEELSFRFPRRTMIRSFLCAITATLTLKVIDATYTGKPIQFSVDAASAAWRWAELFFIFPLLGIFCGVVGGFTVRMMQKVRVVRAKAVSAIFGESTNSSFKKIAEVFLVALISATINYLIVPEYLDRGAFEVLHDLFVPFSSIAPSLSALSSEVFSLFLAGTIRIFMFALAFDIQVPAGSLVPSLFLGACFGRGFGKIVEYIVAHHSSTNPFMILLFGCPSSSSNLLNVDDQSGISLSDNGAGGAPDDEIFATMSVMMNGCSPSASSSSSTSMASHSFHNVRVSVGMFSAVGAAAALTGVTRMTMCLVMIVVEMTGCPGFVLPLVVVSLCAKRAVEYFEFPSIFDLSSPPPSSSSFSQPLSQQNQNRRGRGEGYDDRAGQHQQQEEGTALTDINTKREHDHQSSSSSITLDENVASTRARIVNSVQTVHDLIDFCHEHNQHRHRHQRNHAVEGSANDDNVNSNSSSSIPNQIDVDDCFLQLESTGMTLKEVRETILGLRSSWDDNHQDRKSREMSESESNNRQQQQLHHSPPSRPQPVMIVSHRERIDKRPVLIGVCKLGRILDEVMAHLSSTHSNEEVDLVTFTFSGLSPISSPVNHTNRNTINFMHLLESSFLTVAASSMKLSVLRERLHHDVESTCVVVVDEHGGTPVAAFSRQFLLERR